MLHIPKPIGRKSSHGLRNDMDEAKAIIIFKELAQPGAMRRYPRLGQFNDCTVGDCKPANPIIVIAI